ncbi:MAG: ArsR/SmtB family transcription factor [Acidimicrobiia bacterium]
MLAVLERDAEQMRAISGTMTAERLVEVATSGITFAGRPNVAGVVLIPSVVVRPWVAALEHGNLRIFGYSVADEQLSADPDAPPSWLVQMFKALGDERRLRILGLLAESSGNLTELAERMNLSKSTVHHHLRILRAAGLVRVTIGADKEYSLRADAVPEASGLLDTYLSQQLETPTQKSDT